MTMKLLTTLWLAVPPAAVVLYIMWDELRRLPWKVMGLTTKIVLAVLVWAVVAMALLIATHGCV